MHLAQLQALGDGLEVLALEFLDLLALLRDLRVQLGVLLLDLRVLALVVGVLLVVGGQLRLQPGDGRAERGLLGVDGGLGLGRGRRGRIFIGNPLDEGVELLVAEVVVVARVRVRGAEQLGDLLVRELLVDGRQAVAQLVVGDPAVAVLVEIAERL